jgi:hypothetical protein
MAPTLARLDGHCLGLAHLCCLSHTSGAREVDTQEVNHGSQKCKYRSIFDVQTNGHFWEDYKMSRDTTHTEAMQHQHSTQQRNKAYSEEGSLEQTNVRRHLVRTL